MNNQRKFTETDDAYLRTNYLIIPAKRMSKNLGRSESGARQRMKMLGLIVPPDVTDGFKKASQIQPGTIPKNKGKKQSDYMTPEAIARTAATRFKKGNEPVNTRFDGAERISKDGYVEVRVKKGCFRLKHRVEWEKVNGIIPPGYILSCLGDDLTNCKVANWELISMQENMQRNSGGVNLPDSMVAQYMATSSWKVNTELKEKILADPDLINAKRTQLLINRKIKQHGSK